MSVTKYYCYKTCECKYFFEYKNKMSGSQILKIYEKKVRCPSCFLIVDLGFVTLDGKNHYISPNF